MMIIKYITLAFIVVIGLIASSTNATFCPGHFTFPMNVNTSVGQVSGTYLNEARAFLGIPYAQPPVGALRFAPPVAATPVSNGVNATQWPNACMQSGVTNPVGYTQSEDCLYLNVFTPRCKRFTGFPPTTKMPVMVFIHGGRYWTGYSKQFPGDLLASEKNAVVVSIQYRLNIFGFQSFDSNTNNGLRDQQMALKWVKDNIEAFGGDASSITLFGESAGGSSVLYHLLMPGSYNLYNRGILQSAWQWVIPTSQTSRVNTATWAASAKIGCNNVTVDPVTNKTVPNYIAILSCLRALPATKIIPTTGESNFMLPMVDGDLITTLPLNSFKLGNYNKQANIIVGHNYDEGNFMAFSRLGFKTPLDNVTDATYLSVLNRTLLVYLNQSSTDYIVSQYEPVRQQLGNWYGGAEFFGDYYITCGSILAAEYLNQQGASFKAYIFNYSSPNYPADDWFLAASHGNELDFVFLQPIYTPYNFSMTDDIMAERMSSSWVNFAKYGNSFYSYWTSNYPSASYFGPNAFGFFDTVPYLKNICSIWKSYYELY
ncbi:carboxylesterase [Cavenderia fasciculata]|uniref:Carboxylic ester hydrolase n=1 Tax=Cavenderia fasciculata TaxID=261658 RepID=F4PKC2_CACFS|nr:carboxylesterase [Cavenderia fasciculata]EGG24046.1 carboxylesterase [Cavenderia fasciculata]|eukprot:XP_004361897.1 carboxylesterase [Cavenderia fasciculata]